MWYEITVHCREGGRERERDGGREREGGGGRKGEMEGEMEGERGGKERERERGRRQGGKGRERGDKDLKKIECWTYISEVTTLYARQHMKTSGALPISGVGCGFVFFCGCTLFSLGRNW